VNELAVYLQERLGARVKAITKCVDKLNSMWNLKKDWGRGPEWGGEKFLVLPVNAANQVMYFVHKKGKEGPIYPTSSTTTQTKGGS